MKSKGRKPELKLVKSGVMLGYTFKNIKEILDKEAFERFGRWMFGQTVGIYKGNFLVYKHDFIQFLNGGEPFD